jgi:hypothetical protein
MAAWFADARMTAGFTAAGINMENVGIIPENEADEQSDVLI